MADDWGIKVSKAGKNAESIDPRDLVLHSRYPMLKYHSDNTNSATINAGDTDAHVDFAHDLGYVPAFIAYQDFSGKWQFIPSINFSLAPGSYPYAYSDNTKIRCGIAYAAGAYNLFDSRNNGNLTVYDEHFNTNLEITVGNRTGQGSRNGAMIVSNVVIPQGATISQAELNFAVEFKGTGTGDMKIQTYGIAEDNTSAIGNPMARTRTSAVTTQTVSLPSAGQYFGINVTSQVQEIVNRGGWSSGNNMGFIILDNGSPTDVRSEDDAGTGIESYFTVTISGSTTITFRAIIFKDKIA